MNFRTGYVVETHPEDNSVDMVMSDNFARVVGAQILSPTGSTRTGGVDIPEVPPKPDKWDITQYGEQDLKAVVGYVGRTAFVFGFIIPQINQVTFEDKRRQFYRHQSDVYHTIDGDGNFELYHPSGTYIRLAEDLDHENLEGKNFDANSSQSMKIDRNTDKKPGLKIEVGSQGELAATFMIRPDGSVLMVSENEDIVIGGRNLRFEAQSSISFSAPSGVSFDTPMISTNSMITTDQDVLAEAVSLKLHLTTGVSTGEGISGPPVGG